VANWSKLTPPGGPPAVEHARQAVRSLRERIPAAHQQVAAARARLTEAEASDRIAMAEQLRAGKEPTSDSHGVERARGAIHVAERQHEALALAIEQAEGELHRAVVDDRDEWHTTATRAARDARGRARKALAAFEDALTAARVASGTAWWLEADHGLDRETAAPHPTLGGLIGSQHLTKNDDPVPVADALRWLAALVAEPEPPKPPPEPRPLRPIGMPGALISE
jgi:hypothetical protein